MKGLIVAYSAPYTPQQNGIAERINRLEPFYLMPIYLLTNGEKHY